MEAKIIKAGAVWINEGDPVDRVWMLQKGSLKAASRPCLPGLPH